MITKKIMGFMVLLISIFLVGCGKERLGPGESLYEHQKYQLVLKEGWSITDAQNNVEEELIYNNICVATILFTTNFQYSNIDSLVRYWVGMHAFVQEQTEIEIPKSKGRLFKVEVAWETSAAESAQGIPPWSNELHYFYLSDSGLLIDVQIQDIHTNIAVLEKLESILITIQALE